MTTGRLRRSGTARDRFQPASQHASNFTTSGIELLVGLVRNAFTVFTQIEEQAEAIESYGCFVYVSGLI